MQRLRYIDSMKGFAILFVVFYHLLWCAVKDRDSAIIPFFNSLCMQLFFFLSGFVAYRGADKSRLREVIQAISKKAKALLIPSVILFSFFVWYYQQDVMESILYEFKSGYWFTYVLFFIFALHYLARYIAMRLEGTGINRRWIFYGWLFLAIVANIGHGHAYFFGEWLRCISFSFILKYYVFFLIGYLCCQHMGWFHKMLEYPAAMNLFPLVSLGSAFSVGHTPYGGG